MTALNATRCAVLLFGCSGVAHAQTLKNGSFETPISTSPTQAERTYQNPGSAAIDGWTVEGVGAVTMYQCPISNTSTSHGIPGTNYCSAADGNQYLSLSTQGSLATVSQSVPTRIGGRYLLQFRVAAARDPSVPGTVHVEARDGGTVLGSLTVSAPASHNDGGNFASHELRWLPAEFFFRATSVSTKIILSDVSHKPEDASFIDNVTLEERPSRFEINRNVMFMFAGLVIVGFGLWYFVIRKRGGGVQALR